jgi:hypothetical protein
VPDAAEPGPTAPAEDARLDELLSELREDPPTGSEVLSLRVVSAARWQRHARSALQSIGGLASALAQGAAILLGTRRSRNRRDP